MQICRIFAPEKKQGHVSPELACCLQVKNIRYEEQTPLSELAEKREVYILINQTKLVRQS